MTKPEMTKNAWTPLRPYAAVENTRLSWWKRPISCAIWNHATANAARPRNGSTTEIRPASGDDSRVNQSLDAPGTSRPERAARLASGCIPQFFGRHGQG